VNTMDSSISRNPWQFLCVNFGSINKSLHVDTEIIYISGRLKSDKII
jgi:hypothetical protein